MSKKQLTGNGNLETVKEVLKNSKGVRNQRTVGKKEMKEEEWTRKEKLDYYCNLNNIVTIATKNRKLGSQVCGLSFPAGVTCRPDAPCRKECYCSKGMQQMSSVLGTYLKNYRIWLEDKNMFFDQVSNYLKYSGYRYMRWFDSGDLPNKEFLGDCIEKVIKLNPNVRFLMFTKRYEWVNEYLSENELPENLTVIFSSWNKSWKFENPHNLPVAYVDFEDREQNCSIPEDAKTCDGLCSICYKCWNLKNGESVVFGQH